MKMTVTERIMRALQGKAKGSKPVFAPYENKVVPGKVLDQLLERGMALTRRVPAFQTQYKNCIIKKSTEEKNGVKEVCTRIETPYGVLKQVETVNDVSSYISEHFVKDENDFPAYRYMLQDKIAVSNHKEIEKALQSDEIYFLRGWLPYEPLQQIIIQDMGTENFCFAWMDYRDQLMEFSEIIDEFNKKTFQFAAESKLNVFNYGGNVTPNIIGKEVFDRVYVRQYDEAADVLHKSGKLIGCHFDADNTLILDSIARTKLDYIEAYDISCSPPMSVAVEKNPDKVFWLNFPSPVHLQGRKQVYETTLQLLKEGKEAKGLIMGVTEDVPSAYWEESFVAIMDAIDDFYG